MLDVTADFVPDAIRHMEKCTPCTMSCGSQGSPRLYHEAPPNMQDPPRSAEGRRWFCVQTHPQAERWAKENLDRQGYESLLLFYDVRVRDRVLRTMTRIVERPYLPRYVFVRFDRDRDPWGPICSTRGVQRLLMSTAYVPLPVPDVHIERLIADAAAERILRADAGPGEDLTGERLRLTEGAFAEHEGVCEAGEKERVQMLLSIMGRDVRVTVERRNIEKVAVPTTP